MKLGDVCTWAISFFRHPYVGERFRVGRKLLEVIAVRTRELVLDARVIAT